MKILFLYLICVLRAQIEKKKKKKIAATYVEEIEGTEQHNIQTFNMSLY